MPRSDERSGLPEAMQTLLLGASNLLAIPQLGPVLAEVFRLATAVLPADAYAIWRADSSKSRWHTLGSLGLSGDYSVEIDLSSPHLLDDSPIVATDVQSCDVLKSRSTVYSREGIVSLLAIPMKFAGEPCGTFCFYFRTAHSFNTDQIKAGSLLASLSASAIATAELYEEQSFERTRLELLANAGEVLASSADFEATLQQVAKLAVPKIADWCSVYIVRDGKLENLTIAHQDPAKLALAEKYRRRFPEQVRPGSPTEKLLKCGESGLYPVISEELLAHSIEDQERLDAIKELGIRSVIEVPIVTESSVIGLLRLVSAESRRIFNERDLKLAEELGRRAGIAIENAKLHEALRSQQIQQKLILDTLPSLIAVVDKDQRYRFVNRAYFDWFGICDDLTGTTICGLVGDVAYAKMKKYIDRALAGEVVRYEEEVPFSRGGTKYVSAVYLPRQDNDGNLDGYVAFISDITAQRRIIEEIHRNEERFRGIFVNASVPMVITDLEGHFIQANAAYCKLTGYTEDELRGTAFQFLTHPDDLPENMEQYRRLIAEDIEQFTFEKRYLRKDGNIAWIRVGASLLHDSDSRPLQIIKTGEDITARKVAEIERNRLMVELNKERAELKSTVEQLHMIEDAVSAGTWRFDIKSGISHWPPGISKLWGLPPQKHELSFEEFTRRIHSQDLQRVQDVVRNAIERKEHYEVEFRVIWPDGSAHWLSARGAVVCNEEGEPTSILGIALEATERVKTEEALRQSEKLAATGRLAATIAHEINNPLEAVTNLLYLSRNDAGVPNQIRALLDQADQELGRVSHIAKQTLGFYRESVKPQNVNLSEAVEQVIQVYRTRLVAKQVRLKLDIQPNVIVLAKAGEIRQVFSNLLLNALDAVPVLGSITVRVRQQMNGKARLMVADSGTGIAAPNRSKLFQPFFTTKKDIGTGLGLWVSKGIIENAHGSIHVLSSVNPEHSGTTFIVDLPGAETIHSFNTDRIDAAKAPEATLVTD